MTGALRAAHVVGTRGGAHLEGHAKPREQLRQRQIARATHGRIEERREIEPAD